MLFISKQLEKNHFFAARANISEQSFNQENPSLVGEAY